ncbi:MAG: MFS transporter [Actinobacteria bacterium]|nr:MFS transporter [Actinomycetota bacterium]
MSFMANFSRYRELLSAPDVKTIILSTFPARVAYGALPLTIFFKTFHDTKSIPLAGLAIGANSLASSITSAARGSIVDRYGNKWPLRVFVPSYVAMLIVLNFAHTATSILTIALILGVSAPPINLSVRPLWKTLAPPGQLRTAYALDTSVMSTAGVIGPIMATMLALSSHPGSGLLICALFIAIGGGSLAITRVSRDWVPEKKIEGESANWRHPAMRVLMYEGAFIGFGWGAFSIAVPAFATLEGVPHNTAWILGIMGIANIIGGLIGGLVTRSKSPLSQFRTTYLIWFIICLPLAFTYPSWSLAIEGALLGLTIGAIQVFYWEVMEAVRPAGSPTASMGWLWTIEGSMSAAGSAVGGWLSKTESPRWCLAITTLSVGFGLLILTIGRGRLKAANVVSSEAQDLEAMKDNFSSDGQ